MKYKPVSKDMEKKCDAAISYNYKKNVLVPLFFTTP